MNQIMFLGLNFKAHIQYIVRHIWTNSRQHLPVLVLCRVCLFYLEVYQSIVSDGDLNEPQYIFNRIILMMNDMYTDKVLICDKFLRLLCIISFQTGKKGSMRTIIISHRDELSLCKQDANIKPETMSHQRALQPNGYYGNAWTWNIYVPQLTLLDPSTMNSPLHLINTCIEYCIQCTLRMNTKAYGIEKGALYKLFVNMNTQWNMTAKGPTIMKSRQRLLRETKLLDIEVNMLIVNRTRVILIENTVEMPSSLYNGGSKSRVYDIVVMMILLTINLRIIVYTDKICLFIFILFEKLSDSAVRCNDESFINPITYICFICLSREYGTGDMELMTPSLWFSYCTSEYNERIGNGTEHYTPVPGQPYDALPQPKLVATSTDTLRNLPPNTRRCDTYLRNVRLLSLDNVCSKTMCMNLHRSPILNNVYTVTVSMHENARDYLRLCIIHLVKLYKTIEFCTIQGLGKQSTADPHILYDGWIHLDELYVTIEVYIIQGLGKQSTANPYILYDVLIIVPRSTWCEICCMYLSEITHSCRAF